MPTHIWTFIVASSILSKNWKQPNTNIIEQTIVYSYNKWIPFNNKKKPNNHRWIWKISQAIKKSETKGPSPLQTVWKSYFNQKWSWLSLFFFTHQFVCRLYLLLVHVRHSIQYNEVFLVLILCKTYFIIFYINLQYKNKLNWARYSFIKEGSIWKEFWFKR